MTAPTTEEIADPLAAQVRQKAQGSTDCAFLLHVAGVLEQRLEATQQDTLVIRELCREMDRWRDKLEAAEQHVKILEEQRSPEPSGIPPKAQAIIDAAVMCNFCPDAGGYLDGQSVEGCYEALDTAIQDYYGSNLPYPTTEWWSEEEMRSALTKGDGA